MAKIRAVVIFSIFLLFSFNGLYAKDTVEEAGFAKSGSVWTEAHWVNWWTNIQNLYNSNQLSDEAMYWLLRHDLELLGQAEEILGNIGFPQPYPGWSSGGLGDGVIPYQIKSSPIFTKPPLKEPYVGKFAQYPQEWQAMFEQYGIPQVYLNISSPPLWVAAGMTALGGSLSRAPHPGARFLGYVLADVGGVLIIWIAVEDDIEADDDE